ncbi:histone-lysine N-methyltransferase SETMAR-like [Symphalangus syndactylus]|uniref:histone-lysine N-methyltransferase SETMAR-like n=1 Tax=Symphalangus syndactylus TaxID=9590 RepID=UPI00300702D7
MGKVTTTTTEMTLDKKQIQAIFLFELKTGCKAVRTTRNISNAFGNAFGGSRSFAKDTRALKMKSLVAGHQKLTTTN